MTISNEIKRSRNSIVAEVTMKVFPGYWFQTFPSKSHYICKSCGDRTDIYFIPNDRCSTMEAVCVKCSTMLINSVESIIGRLVREYNEYRYYNSIYFMDLRL